MRVTTKQLTIERQLNHRLKMLGIILLIGTTIAILWNFLPAAENELDELVLELEEAPLPLNPYVAPVALGTVGLSCLLIHWKKKNFLSLQNPRKP